MVKVVSKSPPREKTPPKSAVTPPASSAARAVFDQVDLVENIAGHFSVAALGKTSTVNKTFAAVARDPALWNKLASRGRRQTQLLSRDEVRLLSDTPGQLSLDVGLSLVKETGVYTAVGCLIGTVVLIPLAFVVIDKFARQQREGPHTRRQASVRQAEVEQQRGELVHRLLEQGIPAEQIPEAAWRDSRRLQFHLEAQQAQLVKALHSELRHGFWYNASVLLTYLGPTGLTEFSQPTLNRIAAKALRDDELHILAFLLDQGAVCPRQAVQKCVEAQAGRGTAEPPRLPKWCDLVPRHADLPPLSTWDHFAPSLFGDLTQELPPPLPVPIVAELASPALSNMASGQPLYQKLLDAAERIGGGGPASQNLVRAMVHAGDHIVEITMRDARPHAAMVQTLHEASSIADLMTKVADQAANKPFVDEGQAAHVNDLVQMAKKSQTTVRSYAALAQTGPLRDAMAAHLHKLVDTRAWDEVGQALVAGVPSSVRVDEASPDLASRLHQAAAQALEAADFVEYQQIKQVFEQAPMERGLVLNAAGLTRVRAALAPAVAAGNFKMVDCLLNLGAEVTSLAAAVPGSPPQSVQQRFGTLLTESIDGADLKNAEVLTRLLKNHSNVPDNLPWEKLTRQVFQKSKEPSLFLRQLVQSRMEQLAEAGQRRQLQALIREGGMISQQCVDHMKSRRRLALTIRDFPSYMQWKRMTVRAAFSRG
jgi:hypothetical protein